VSAGSEPGMKKTFYYEGERTGISGGKLEGRRGRKLRGGRHHWDRKKKKNGGREK